MSDDPDSNARPPIYPAEWVEAVATRTDQRVEDWMADKNVRAALREIAAIDAERRQGRLAVVLAFVAVLVACAVAWWRSR